MKRPCIIVKFSDFDDVIKGMWGNILKDFEVEGYSVHNLLLNGYTHTHKHTHTHTNSKNPAESEQECGKMLGDKNE